MLINDDRNFKRSLDEQTAAQHKLHIDALDRALAKHQEVRETADRTRQRIELEIETERQRQIAEEQKAFEKAKQEREEQEWRQKMDKERAEVEARSRRETIRREQEEVTRKAEAEKQRVEEEKARKQQQDKQDADRRATQEAEAREKQQQAENDRQRAAQQPSQPFPQVNGASTRTPAGSSSIQPVPPTQSSSAPANIPPGLVSSPNEREAIHNKYLNLHKGLKQMRQHVLDEAKKVPGLKDQVSDWRRTIQKCCGQLGKGSSEEIKATNRAAVSHLPTSLLQPTNTNPAVAKNREHPRRRRPSQHPQHRHNALPRAKRPTPRLHHARPRHPPLPTKPIRQKNPQPIHLRIGRRPGDRRRHRRPRRHHLRPPPIPLQRAELDRRALGEIPQSLPGPLRRLRRRAHEAGKGEVGLARGEWGFR